MPYLTIQQAVEVTGKSEKTIRRLCNEQKSARYITREEGKLMIDSNYLEQHYPMKMSGQWVDKSQESSLDMSKSQAPDNLYYVVDVLKQQLSVKDEQIKALTESLTSIKLLTAHTSGEEMTKKEASATEVQELRKQIEELKTQLARKEQAMPKRWWHFW